MHNLQTVKWFQSTFYLVKKMSAIIYFLSGMSGSSSLDSFRDRW